MSLETPGGLWADVADPQSGPLTEEQKRACRRMIAQNHADIEASIGAGARPVTDGSFDDAAYAAALEQGNGPVTARRAGITGAAVVALEGVQNA